MIINDHHFSIHSFQKTNVDETFLKVSYTFQRQFPFKWDFFVNDIIGNPEVTYVKDTTAIINLETLDFKDLPTLFGILKMYLNYKVIIKIIHKKEFVIAHFDTNFHMEYITLPTMLMSLSLYHIIHQAGLGEVYFGGVLTTQNDKKIINIILNRNNKIYLFDGNDKVNYELDDNCFVVRLYSKLKLSSLNGHENAQMKLVFCEEDYLKELQKIMQTAECI